MVKNFLFKTKKRVAVLLCAALLCVALLLGYAAYDYYFVTGLASDEEMIAQFYEHKAELEGIVKKFRKTGRGDYDELQSAGAFNIRVPGYGKLFLRFRWFCPEDLGKKLMIDEMGRKKYKMSGEERWEFNHKYGPVRIRMLPIENYWQQTRRFSVIRKDIFHIPNMTNSPMVEDGDFLVSSSDPPYNYYKFEDYVLSSLNQLPSRWDTEGCVFRKIETHWYIRMCSIGWRNESWIERLLSSFL